MGELQWTVVRCEISPITWSTDYSVRFASKYGHLSVVEYLVSVKSIGKMFI
jgi:hypothetical protein